MAIRTYKKRKAIRPDFFIELPNGYCNILEFKLPNIDYPIITGVENREKFSSQLYSNLAQTRVYTEYFHDINNRDWLKLKKGINVHFPKRILVVGRRWNFEKEKWKEVLSEFKDTELVTYDDLIDCVSAHLYIE